MSVGPVLQEARRAKGVTLEQAAAATRIRVRSLAALEADRVAELPAPVYVRGYLRTYAAYLEIDAEPLVEAYEERVGRSERSLAIRPMSALTAAPNMVLTAPAAGAIGLVLLVLAFTGYVYRELESVRTPPPAPRLAATPLPTASPTPLASPSPTPVPTPVPATVIITATDGAWIDVSVDGKKQFGDAGKVLAAGGSVTFTGIKVKVTSGKGLATFVNVNGKDLGAMGNGVITREYTAAS
jgi:cytoskeleton protein RodZ